MATERDRTHTASRPVRLAAPSLPFLPRWNKDRHWFGSDDKAASWPWGGGGKVFDGKIDTKAGNLDSRVSKQKIRSQRPGTYHISSPKVAVITVMRRQRLTVTTTVREFDNKHPIYGKRMLM